MSFEKKLQSLRKTSNISQEELANQLGVSRQAVSKWESGVSYPEMDKLILMTKIFNCTLDDLVNDEVTDTSIMNQEPKKGQNYIDSLLEFITKSINMFTSMKFSNVMRCIIELVAIGCILALVTFILYQIAAGIILSVFPVHFGSTAFMVLYFIGAIFLFLFIALDVVVFFQFYKIRYLDYYDKLIYEYQQEKNEKIKRNAEEISDDNQKKAEHIRENKRETIIIRDPDHRPLAFLSTISNIIIIIFKAFVLCFSWPFLFSLVALIIGLVISIYLIFTNFIFFGITLAIIALIAVNLELIVLLYNFLFNKRVLIKCLFAIFIISIFVGSIGVGLSCISFRNIDIVEINQESEKLLEKDIPYNSELYFNEPNYNSPIKYVVDNTLKDNVKVSVNYSERFYDINLVETENGMEFHYAPLKENSSKEFIDKILNNLKNNKFEIYSGYGTEDITIASSEDNIRTLIKNISNEQNVQVVTSKNTSTKYYKVYYLDTSDYGKRVCEIDDFYYKCVNVDTSYEIEPNFKYEYKDGVLEYDKTKYRCDYYSENRSYTCRLKYPDEE